MLLERNRGLDAISGLFIIYMILMYTSQLSGYNCKIVDCFLCHGSFLKLKCL